MSDESDYKDYQDYLEYQKHISQPQQAPKEPGLIEKGIDMIPGMKQRREDIAQHRSTPEYQASHPKPVTGMEDPAYAYGVGLVGPESITTLLSSGAKGLRGLFKGGSDRAEVMDKVKNVTQLEPYVQGKVNEAAEMFNKKQIAPRMLEQQSRMEGHTVKLDPKSLQGLTPELDHAAASLTPGTNGLAEIPATEAIKLRGQLNKVAGWKAHPMDATKAQALDAQAANLHQNIAKQMSEIDPAMEPLSQEMQQAYTTQKQAIGNAGRDPVKAVLQNDGAAGLTKKGRLASFDQQAGSDLSTLGQNIKTANDRSRPMSLSDILSIHGPKQVLNKATAPALNAFDRMAAGQYASPDANLMEKLKALTQKGAAITNLKDSE